MSVLKHPSAMTELLISGLQDSKIVARCNATEKIAEVIGGKNGINNLTVSLFAQISLSQLVLFKSSCSNITNNYVCLSRETKSYV